MVWYGMVWYGDACPSPALGFGETGDVTPRHGFTPPRGPGDERMRSSTLEHRPSIGQEHRDLTSWDRSHLRRTWRRMGWRMRMGAGTA